MAVGPDIADSAHPVDVEHDKVGSAGGGHGGGSVNFKLGTGPGEGLPDEGAKLTLDQIEHHTAHAFVGVVNVLGDLDAAVFADGQDAVVIQQRLAAGLLTGFDHILEENLALDLCGDGLLKARMGDGHLSFNGRKDTHVDLIVCGRTVGRRSGSQQKYGAASGHDSVAEEAYPREVWFQIIHFLRADAW